MAALHKVLYEDPGAITGALHFGEIDPNVIAQLAIHLATDIGQVFVTVVDMGTEDGEPSQQIRLWSRQPSALYGFIPRNSSTVATAVADPESIAAALKSLRQRMHLRSRQEIPARGEVPSQPTWSVYTFEHRATLSDRPQSNKRQGV